MAKEFLLLAGTGLILLGFLLILLYALLEGAREGRAEAGGVILIGPIPIIFGTSSWMALAAAVVGLLLLLLSVFLTFNLR